jgi:hypothetical protein
MNIRVSSIYVQLDNGESEPFFGGSWMEHVTTYTIKPGALPSVGKLKKGA